MPKACSLDLRERVIEAVEGGASRREAAARFEVSAAEMLGTWSVAEKDGNRACFMGDDRCQIDKFRSVHATG